ncbi:MAG: DUF3854 domain-containing protein [Crinalium sp.]
MTYEHSDATHTFDIRNFSSVLQPAKKGSYICPNCNEPKLTFSNNGKYNCWHCNDTKQIARILTEPEREERRRQREEANRLQATLTPDDRKQEWIEFSGIPESITSANLRHTSDSPEMVAQLLGWKYYKGTTGWYVLSCDPITGKRSNNGQFKPDEPIDFPDSEPAKYVSFPKKSQSNKGIDAIYLALTLNDWIKISDRTGIPFTEDDIDKTRDDLGFWAWVQKNPEIPIIITEGIKKAACLLGHGWVAICLAGVTCGQRSGKKLLESLTEFIVPGRPVFLAFDADIVEKTPVRRALIQLCQLIKRTDKTSITRIIQWDLALGKGCDDLIVNHKVEAFETAMDEAISYSQWIKEINTQYQESYTGSSNGGGNNNNNNGNSGGDNNNNGNSGGGNGGDNSDSSSDDNNQKPNHHERRYERICKSLGLPFEHCVTAGTFDGYVYRTCFEAGEKDWKTIDTAFYRYTGLGYWQNQPDKLLHKIITDASDRAFKLKFSKEEGWVDSHPYETNNHAESAFKYCRKRLEPIEPLPTNGHLRAFRNCTVDMRTGETMPHSPKNYLTSGISYDYYPNRHCPDVFYQFLCDAYGEDLIPVIRAFTSMFLDPTAPYGVFPHLLGQSGSGKGTLGRLWNSLYGDDGSGSGVFSDIATPEGRHQYLTGKTIFGIPDIGGYVTGLRAFYELVDNGELTGRALFNPTGYQKSFNCRFWVGSVDHLQIENAGDGWERRAYPIPTQGKPSKVDPELRQKLEAVKADIISWALAMPRSERDAILLTPPTNYRIVNLKHDAALYGDSVKSFVDLCLRPTEEQTIMPTHLLHSLYTAYCQAHGYVASGMSKFISHFKNVLTKNFVDRRWGAMKDGLRRMQPAHFTNMEILPGTFVDIASDFQSSNGYQTDSKGSHEPEWKCLKSHCVEGGLMEFEDFWNPQPPDDDPGTDGGGGGSPIPPPFSPDGGNMDQGGSGSTKNYESTPIHPQTTKNQAFSDVDQGGSGGSGLLLSHEKNFDEIQKETENSQPLSSPLIHPDPVAQVTENQCVQGNQSIQQPELNPALKEISELLMLVETGSDLKAVTQIAAEKGLPDNWKKFVWSHLDKNTQAKIKRLKQQQLPTTEAPEAIKLEEKSSPPFPSVDDLVWRKPTPKYPEAQICRIIQITPGGAYTDNKWHISHYAWEKGDYVPYSADSNDCEY